MSAKISSDLLKYFKAAGFHKNLEKVKLISIGKGSCLAELKVGPEHTNPMQTLHGGFSATLVDALTSAALFTQEKCAVPSVSIDLHMTYLKAAGIGDEIVIDSQTIKAGKTMAYLKCEIKNKATGELLARGSHTKFLMHPRE